MIPGDPARMVMGQRTDSDRLQPPVTIWDWINLWAIIPKIPERFFANINPQSKKF
jgi:hypothetical protein